MSENTTPPKEEAKVGESFMSHLIEMRDRVMRMMLAILMIFLSLFYWANEIYTYLAQPLIRHLPEGSTMIAIDVASPFLTPFKLVLMLSIFLAMPVILFQLWAFVAPGLYKHEKRLAIPLLISSVFLFYLGIAFAYYVVFPLVFGFFTSIGPADVTISTDIGRYLDFVLSIFFGFGLAFEVPVATIIVIAIGLTTPDKLASKRPYVIVGAFVIGMLLTPPDIISQLLLAIPMWLLFECGLLAARYLLPEKLVTKPLDDDPGSDPKPDTKVESSIGGAGIYGSGYEVINDPANKTSDSEPSSSTDNKTDTESDKPVYDENDDDDYDSLDEEDYEEFQALTEEEMDAELDRIEDDEDEEENKNDNNSESSGDDTKVEKEDKKKP